MATNNCCIVEALAVGSYNVKGVIRNVLYLDKLLKEQNLDICIVCEHWLFEDSLSFMDAINVNYVSLGVSDISLNPLDPYRRGKGGVGILWKENLSPVVRRIDCNSDRILGISIQVSKHHSITIIGVYLPDTSHGREPFTECLEKLQDLYYTYCDVSEVIIAGDFNAQLVSSGINLNIHKPRDIELQEVLNNLGMTSVITLNTCTGPNYTFCGYEGGPKTLIDHLVIQDTKLDLVLSTEIISESTDNLSDHLPIVMRLNVKPFLESIDEKPKSVLFKWKKLTLEQIRSGYGADLYTRLSNIKKPELTTVGEIKDFYETLTQTMHRCAEKHIPTSSYKRHLKPYWKNENGVLKTLHKDMRETRILWIREGKPRGNQYSSYKEYKKAKKVFRNKMRLLALKAETDFYEEIDRAAAIDQDSFWRLVNGKRKRKGHCVHELKVDGKIYRGSDEILKAWEDHFKLLYTEPDDNDVQFDRNFKLAIEQEYRQIINDSPNELDEITDSPISLEDVETQVKKMKLGKAGGYDTVSNEHLKYGGRTLYEHLVHLLNGILNVEQVPKTLKRGVLITIHKGTNKYKDDRKNHRGITLLNTIYKLLEMIMLQRFQTQILLKRLDFPSNLQGAYQAKLCSVMTSFNFQETVAYYLERYSKVYAGLLDTATAFDTVWHCGLLVKLHRFGIKGKLWRLVKDCYTDIETTVMFQGIKSDWIKVERSVRQGGVLSPWLYMLYINDLPGSLKLCEQGGRIGDLISCATLHADDVTLISPSVSGLQSLINIVEEYAFKWRYEINATKSKVLVFGGRRKQQNYPNETTWKLNGKSILASTQEKHVGILLNTNLKSHDRTKEACRKGRNSLMSLLAIGTKGIGLNPINSATLLKSIVLPRSLYGAELWNNLSGNEITVLERMLCFCCKIIQNLDKRCRSDMCRSMLGFYQMKGQIDLRKLLFLGRIVWLPDRAMPKKIFKQRVLQFLVYKGLDNDDDTQMGFIPDIVKILQKYQLDDHWEKYIKTGFTEFPIYSSWKILIKKAVQTSEQREWLNRTENDEDFSLFKQVHSNTGQPSQIWKYAQRFPEQLDTCRSVAKFITKTPTSFINIQLCCYCGKFYSDIYLHLAMECSKCFDEREKLWNDIINNLSVEFSVYLNNIEDDQLFCLMLGKTPESCFLDEKDLLFKLSSSFLRSIMRYIY